MSVVERLAEVRSRVEGACARAGRRPDSVRLIAVSKRQPDASLEAAFAAGHRDFGENYVQELLRKQDLLPEAHFHLIGHVQSNKAKKAASAHLVHTVDSEKVARGLAKGLEGGRRLGVLLEVNVAEEPQKAGVVPAEAASLLERVAGIDGLEARGLMCIPPVGEGRRWFAALRSLVEDLRRSTGLELPELSMGMSADFEDAILEGATLVRVGTAIFGPRAE